MANALKTNGLVELSALRRRITRQWNLGRIYDIDWQYLMKRCDEIEARIMQMEEESS